MLMQEGIRKVSGTLDAKERSHQRGGQSKIKEVGGEGVIVVINTSMPQGSWSEVDGGAGPPKKKS